MKDIERRFINPQQGALDTVLPDAAAYAAVERDVLVSNIDVTNNLTVRTQTGQTINGGLTVVVGPGNAALFLSDGSGWRTVGLPVGPGISAHLSNSVAISVTSGAVKQLTFDTVRYDTGGFVNGSTFVIPATGIYLVGASVEFSSSAVGNTRILELRINGSVPIAIDQRPPILGGFNTSQTASAQYALGVGVVVNCAVFQDSGGPLNINAANVYSPEFWIQRVG